MPENGKALAFTARLFDRNAKLLYYDNPDLLIRKAMRVLFYA
jgi:hypothetical protein